MAENPEAFAPILKRLRAEKGLTQAQLAERSGLGLSTVRQLEYGRREPTYATLLKLAAGLGVSLSAFEPAKGKGKKGGA